MTTSISPRENVDYEWEDIAAALLAAKGIRAGLWRVSVMLHFTGVTMNWTPVQAEGSNPTTDPLPTALVAIKSLALVPVDDPGPLVFDAARKGRAAPAEPEKQIKRARRKATGKA